jgi:hypothetical protein
LILGCILLSATVVWTYTGRAWVRFYGWVYRAEEPSWFWWEVSFYCLLGVGLIGLFFVKVT